MKLHPLLSFNLSTDIYSVENQSKEEGNEDVDMSDMRAGGERGLG